MRDRMEPLTDSRARDAQQTRERILAAAVAAFSRSGYAETGVREVAAAAGVDPALIRRYFGSKAGLLEAALIANIQKQQMEALPPTRDGAAAYIIQRILTNQTEVVFPIVTLSANDKAAKRIGRKVLDEYILPPLADWLGEPDALARATTLFVVSCGLQLFVRASDMDDEAALSAAVLDRFRVIIQDIVDPIADDLYDVHLKELKPEGLIK